MNTDHVDPDLERRYRAVLQEVMPQLEPVSAGHSLWNEDECTADADDSETFIRADVAALPMPRREDAQFPRRPRALLVAASLVAVVGVGAALFLTAGRGGDGSIPTATVPPTAQASVEPTTQPTTTLAVQADTSAESVFTTPIPAGLQPMVVIDRPGWKIDGYSGPSPVYQAGASATCAGCGVNRLVVAGDGPLWVGPVFTAWVLEADFDITVFDSPVTIGAAQGRFTSSADSGQPVNQVRMAWPLEPGRTAFVEAAAMSEEQVIAMAEALTFESAIPTLANPPAGFVVVPAPTDAGLTTQIYTHFDSGTVLVDDHGTSVIEVIASDGGVQGLFDWRSPSRPLGWGEPRVINGTTILLDRDPDPNEPPILTIEATWTVGDWNYTAIGHVFATEADFLDALATLVLTDEATFASVAGPAGSGELPPLKPNPDGSGGGEYVPSDRTD